MCETDAYLCQRSMLSYNLCHQLSQIKTGCYWGRRVGTEEENQILRYTHKKRGKSNQLKGSLTETKEEEEKIRNKTNYQSFSTGPIPEYMKTGETLIHVEHSTSI